MLLPGISPAIAQPVPVAGASKHPTAFTGPGRDEPEPSGVKEVLVGWFGPSDAHHPDADLFEAASLAIEEANGAGGYRGLPFRLVPAWSDHPWTAGAANVARLVFEEGVWGLIGSPDGSSTHLAEQVVAKAWVTLVNPAATDRSLHMANVPWIFSIPPADDLVAAALAPEIVRRAGGTPFAAIAATDHDSRLAMMELRAALSRLHAAPLHQIDVVPGVTTASEIAGKLSASGVRTVVVIADPAESARIVSALRSAEPDPSLPTAAPDGARNMNGSPAGDRALAIFGGASMGRRAFLDATAAEGTVFPLTCDAGAMTERFARAFATRSGRAPDCASAQAYDAASLLVEAIRKAGLNRARIREAVQALSPWAGASGSVRFNPLNQNERPVVLATVHDGRIEPL